MALLIEEPLGKTPQPKTITDLPTLRVPKGLVTVIGTPSGGTNTALMFGSFNEYQSNHPISFNGNEFTFGSIITVPTLTQQEIVGLFPGVLSRAGILNPLTNNSLREPKAFLFAITSTKIILVVTDGVSYAEAKIGTYTISAGVLTPTLPNTPMTRVTNKCEVTVGVSRTSSSGDDLKLDFADAFVHLKEDKIVITLNRAFGKLNGWVSFDTDLTITTLTPNSLHPVVFFTNEHRIDLAEDILPPIPIPNIGVFAQEQNSDDFRLNKQGGVTDPTKEPNRYSVFEYVDEHTFTLPVGSSLILGGTTYQLDRQLSTGYQHGYHNYIYVIRVGNELIIKPFVEFREPNFNEVLVATVTNGIEVTESYVVIVDKLISTKRRGSTIGVFEDDGDKGINSFFKLKDKI